MADTATQTDQLKIEMFFVDGDTRTLTLQNFNENTATSEAISELNAFLQANNLIIGDKGGATFGKITKASRLTRNTITIDINEELDLGE